MKGQQLFTINNDLTDNGLLTEVVNIARQLKHFGGKSRRGRARCDGDGYGDGYGCGDGDGYGNGYGSLQASLKPKPSARLASLKPKPSASLALTRGKRSANDERKEDMEELKQNYLENSNKETATRTEIRTGTS